MNYYLAHWVMARDHKTMPDLVRKKEACSNDVTMQSLATVPTFQSLVTLPNPKNNYSLETSAMAL